MADLTGQDALTTGVWFHVTHRRNVKAVMTSGLKIGSESPDFEGAARWTVDNAVYVWPTEQAAREWMAERQQVGGYRARQGDEFTLLGAFVAPHECRQALWPDNEAFGGLLGFWSTWRDEGTWPQDGYEQDGDFYRQMLDCAGDDGVTLDQWLNADGADAYDESNAEQKDDDEYADDRLAALDVLAAMPDTLRNAVLDRWSASGRAMMLFGNIPARRVAPVVP